MTANPFLKQSRLNMLLEPELCQRVHYAALRVAVRGIHPKVTPNCISLSQLRQCGRWQGPGAYISHPDDIKLVFDGVTLAVYQSIESLYCSRVGRSIPMVWRILDAMASRANAGKPAYEGVWAICLYLEERHRESCAVTIDRTEKDWWLAQIRPDVWIRGKSDFNYTPSIVCVLDAKSPRVLAFRISPQEEAEANIPLVLYDAIVSQRRPSSQGAAGLVWPLPKRIVTEVSVNQNSINICAHLGIQIERTEVTLPLLAELRQDWWRDLAGRTYSKQQFAMLFDNHLDKVRGYGPYSEQQERDREFASMRGYNRDPSALFQELRNLLPVHQGTIAEDGAVEYDGLHYSDAVLTFFPHRTVTLRQSEQAECRAWVYLENEVLCEAMARELRREDEEYRPNRARR